MIIGGTVSLCVSILAGVAIHRSNKASDAVEKNTSDIAVLKQIAVTEAHVRQIFKEEVSPLAINIEKILPSLHNLELHIAEERGRKAAILEQAQRRSTDTQQ